MNRGKFITFEGGEGAGKSTQTNLLSEKLVRAGYQTLVTREPGGSVRAEMIREILLEGRAAQFGPFAEALLFSLARQDHLEKAIRPALKAGKWVICDRFMDSTRAYQGAGGGLSPEIVSGMERVVVGTTYPDLTIILDVPPEHGLERVKQRQMAIKGASIDHFESKDIAFHQRLRASFLKIAEDEPERCVVVNALQPADRLSQLIWTIVLQRFRT